MTTTVDHHTEMVRAVNVNTGILSTFNYVVLLAAKSAKLPKPAGPTSPVASKGERLYIIDKIFLG
jgi:hypothetical protein